MPGTRVGVLASCDIMSRVGGARVVGHTVQVEGAPLAKAAALAGRGVGAQVQTLQGEVHRAAQLAAESLHR